MEIAKTKQTLYNCSYFSFQCLWTSPDFFLSKNGQLFGLSPRCHPEISRELRNSLVSQTKVVICSLEGIKDASLHLKKMENYERWKMDYFFLLMAQAFYRCFRLLLDKGLLLLRSVQQYQTSKTHGGQLHQNPEPIFTCPETAMSNMQGWKMANANLLTNPKFAKKDIESLEGLWNYTILSIWIDIISWDVRLFGSNINVDVMYHPSTKHPAVCLESRQLPGLGLCTLVHVLCRYWFRHSISSVLNGTGLYCMVYCLHITVYIVFLYEYTYIHIYILVIHIN